jgi:hypothetical protein
MKSRVSATFYLSTALGGTAGMVGAVAISGLSAFAMRRLGVEMQWLQVAASGAAGGVVGNLLLRGAMQAIAKLGWPKKALDRFVAYLLCGFGSSLLLGGAMLAYQYQGRSGAIGPGLFVVIGWMVGLLASSLPLAIHELQADE